MSGHLSEIPTPEILRSLGASNGVGINHGSAAGSSVMADLPPTAAGSMSHIEGHTLNVAQGATGSLGITGIEYGTAYPHPNHGR